MKYKNIISIFIFMVSLTFFLAASSIDISSNDLNSPPKCYHCGTVAACEEGGQVYGRTNCDYFPNSSPTDNCRVHGSSACG